MSERKTRGRTLSKTDEIEREERSLSRTTTVTHDIGDTGEETTPKLSTSKDKKEEEQTSKGTSIEEMMIKFMEENRRINEENQKRIDGKLQKLNEENRKINEDNKIRDENNRVINEENLRKLNEENKIINEENLRRINEEITTKIIDENKRMRDENKKLNEENRTLIVENLNN
ncbi:arginine and glutamate-rich protein 1-like [Onthophagus taurus]|uniref:arginine and glutamate-rich protein 1-like n=1 Tax=Onthophagus taurus TaxID=166361 RepID=UPI0039BE6F8A